MAISVAIITNNRALLLKQCLQSLVNQTRKPDEVIVVDNASTDSTKKIVQAFKHTLRLRYFYTTRQGYSHNRNLAIKKSKFPTIAWIDDDCTAFPDWLLEIEKSLRIGMYLFQGIDIDDKLNVFSYAQNLRTDEFRYFSEQLLNTRVELPAAKAKQIYGIGHKIVFRSINSVDHRSFVYRKEILNRLPYWFNERLPSYFSADEWDILRRIRNAGYYVLLNPRIKVIHHGRSTFPAFIRRQLQYGQNDAIREWLDKERRGKVYALKQYVHDDRLKKFFNTNQLWFNANRRVFRDLSAEHIPLVTKATVCILFFLGKVIRYAGKIYEKCTKQLLSKPGYKYS